jgi:hypothetical protein
MTAETLRQIERMAASAATHDYAQAQAALAAARAGIGVEIAARLDRIAHGEVPISVEDGIAFVGDAAPAARHACIGAMRYLHGSGVAPIPVVIVDCTDATRVAMTIPIVPGAAYVAVPSRDEDLAAAAAHELAHAHIRSGNPFLDEGMAYHFELSACGDFPRGAARRVADAQGRCAGSRTLLAYDAIDDPFFDKLLPGNGTLVHAQGALVFGALRDKIGMAAAAEWYGALAAQGDARDGAAAALEAALGESLESLDARLGFRSVGASSLDFEPREIDKAYVRGEHATLERIHESLIERGEPATPPDRRAFDAELIAMVGVIANRAAARRLSRMEYALVKGRIARYSQIHGRTPRFFLYRGILASCRAPGEDNYLDAAIYLDDARVDLEMALARDPNDAQILSCVARWEWGVPPEFGGSRGRARDLLERIAAIPEHADDVRASLERARAEVP